MYMIHPANQEVSQVTDIVTSKINLTDTSQLEELGKCLTEAPQKAQKVLNQDEN